MEQQLLQLIYLHYLVWPLSFLPCKWKIHLSLFCCYLSYYHYHPYHFHHHLFHLYNNSTKFLMSWKIVTMSQQIIHWHNNMKSLCIVHKCISYLCNTWYKRSIIFEDWLFISSVYTIRWCNRYYSLYKHMCIA